MGCCQCGPAVSPIENSSPQNYGTRLKNLDTLKSKFYVTDKENRLWKIHKEETAYEIGYMLKNNRSILSLERHDHILRPTSVLHASATSIAIQQPRASNDLFNLLSEPFDWDYISQQLIGISHAILYLHSRGIAHRDIKPENIVHHDGFLKLIDFDFSYPLSVLAHCGTEHFKCPKSLTEKWQTSVEEKSKKMDVYAFGKLVMSIMWHAAGHRMVPHGDFAFDTFHKKCVDSRKHPYTGSWGQWATCALLCLMEEPPSQIPIYLIVSEACTTKGAVAFNTDLQMSNTCPVFT